MTTSSESSNIDADRLTPAIGAELSNVPTKWLSGQMSGSDRAAIDDELYQHLIDHQVIVIRDANLSAPSLAAMGSSFGELGARHHSYPTHPESDDVVILEWSGDDKPDAAEWHSDMTYRPNPPFASIVQAAVVPPSGGDTLWASMYAVHDALPDGLRSDLENLEVVHDMGAFRTPAYQSDGVAGIEKAMIEAGTAVHPAIMNHPVTGRPYLNVSESFTRWIIGLSAPESARLLTEVFDLINRPEFHCRVRHRPGTLVMWDNRGTQHYGVADYLPHRRVLHRVAVSTDRRARRPAA